MSKATICDFCTNPIGEQDAQHFVTIDLSADGYSQGKKLDMCDTCYISPVILSEQRRTRTRKRPKVGRPRGRRNRVSSDPNELVAVLLSSTDEPTNQTTEVSNERTTAGANV